MAEEEDNVSGYSKLYQLAVLKNGREQTADDDSLSDDDGSLDTDDTDNDEDTGDRKNAPPGKRPTFDLPRVATSSSSSGMGRTCDKAGSAPLLRRLSINSAPALSSEEVMEMGPSRRRRGEAGKGRLLPPIKQPQRRSLMEDVNVSTSSSQARGRSDVDSAVEETFNRLARRMTTPHSGPTSPRPPPTSTRFRAKRLSSSGPTDDPSGTAAMHLSTVTFVENSQLDEHGRGTFAPFNELNCSFDGDGTNQLFAVMNPDPHSLSISLNEDAESVDALDHAQQPPPVGSPRSIMLKPTGILNCSNPAMPAPAPPRQQPKIEPFGRRISRSSRTPDSGRLTPRFPFGGRKCDENDDDDDDEDHVSRIMQMVKRMNSSDASDSGT